MNDHLLKVKNVSLSFGKIKAAKNINLEIKKGEFFGLIGPNGAGKTTLFKILLGLLKPDRGQVEFFENDLYESWDRELRSKIGYLPENVILYDYLTGRETLEYFSKLKGVPKTAISEVIETLNINHYMDRKVKEYSKGMRQRLGLAQAILSKPEILFLDEPTSGLDPKGVNDLFTVLFKLKDQGVTLIMTSHILKEVQERVDRLGMIIDGDLKHVGSLQELRSGLELEHTINLYMKKTEELEFIKSLDPKKVSILKKSDSLYSLSFLKDYKEELVAKVLKSSELFEDIEVISPGLDDVFHGIITKNQKNKLEESL